MEPQGFLFVCLMKWEFCVFPKPAFQNPITISSWARKENTLQTTSSISAFSYPSAVDSSTTLNNTKLNKWEIGEPSLLIAWTLNVILIWHEFVSKLSFYWAWPFYWTQVHHRFALSVTLSVWQSSCWDLIGVTLACEESRNLSKSHTTSPKVTKHLLALPAVSVLTAMLMTLEQNKSHVVGDVTKQKSCCWCRMKTKAIFFMSEQNQRLCCWSWNKTKAWWPIFSPFHIWFMEFSIKLLHWLVSIDTSCNMDLSKLIHGFVKVILLWTKCVEWVIVLNALAMFLFEDCLLTIVSWYTTTRCAFLPLSSAICFKAS